MTYGKAMRRIIQYPLDSNHIKILKSINDILGSTENTTDNVFLQGLEFCHFQGSGSDKFFERVR